jgi:hypothetical protein
LTDFAQRWGIWILLALTGLAYLPLLEAGYVWDDSAIVQDNRLTGDLLGNLGEIFTTDLWHTLKLGSADSGYYRPLMLLSLALDRALFGMEPAWHHAHSILWHLGCVLALWGLLRKLLSWERALLGAAIFALHPVQIEAVALIAARNDAMAASMAMAALLLVGERDSPPWKLGLAGLLTLLGLLSKETAVLAPVLLLALDTARFGRPVGWRRYLALGAGVLGFLGMRAAAGVGSGGMPETSSWGILFSQLHEVLGIYGSLLIWPWPLTPARHLLWMPEPSWPFLVGGAVALGLLVLAVWKGKDRRLVLAGLVWALAAWAPTVLATVDKGLLGERYLYFPLAGLALVVASAVPRSPRLLLWTAAAALPALVMIELRLPDWQTSRSLWTQADEDFPTPFTAGGLAFYVYQDRDYPEAEQLFVRAVGGEPAYRDTCTHLVMVGLAQKDPQKAVELGGWGLRERGCPQIPETMGYYAVALAATGRWETAAGIAQRLPSDPFGHQLIVLGAEAMHRADFAGYEDLKARWRPASSYDEQVARVLRMAEDSQALMLQQALLEGRIQRLEEDTPVPEGATVIRSQ